MKNIVSVLTLNGKAEVASDFYLSVFPKSKVLNTLLCGVDGPGPEGSVLMITIEINGQQLILLNQGPKAQFTPAISLMIECENQEEIDHIWNKFLEGGEASACGWIADKFGVTWQVTPAKLLDMVTDQNKEKAARAFRSMCEMIKLDINELEKAYAGG